MILRPIWQQVKPATPDVPTAREQGIARPYAHFRSDVPLRRHDGVGGEVEHLAVQDRGGAPVERRQHYPGGLADLHRVDVGARAIEELQAGGVFCIGLDSEGQDILEEAIPAKGRTAIVLGAEGKGLRQKTRDTCSVLARLDMPGAIRSLNVSNAAVLALDIATRQ